MSIIAHTGHSHGIDPGLVALVIVALILGSVAAMAALRAWQQRAGPDTDTHNAPDGTH
ncbi:MAG TPA: hypothetical protein VFZ37_04570 [Jiangellaceae bacterium]